VFREWGARAQLGGRDESEKETRDFAAYGETIAQDKCAGFVKCLVEHGLRNEHGVLRTVTRASTRTSATSLNCTRLGKC